MDGWIGEWVGGRMDGGAEGWMAISSLAFNTILADQPQSLIG